MFVEIILEEKDINFMTKANRVSYWASVSRFLWCLYALEANVTSTYGLGKASVSVIWLKGIILLFLKKSWIVCFKFLLLNYSFSSTNLFFFFKKTGKTLCSAQWLVLDAKFSLAQNANLQSLTQTLFSPVCMHCTVSSLLWGNTISILLKSIKYFLMMF